MWRTAAAIAAGCRRCSSATSASRDGADDARRAGRVELRDREERVALLLDPASHRLDAVVVADPHRERRHRVGHHVRVDPPGMVERVAQGQGGAEGLPDQRPALDAERGAQRLELGDVPARPVARRVARRRRPPVPVQLDDDRRGGGAQRVDVRGPHAPAAEHAVHQQHRRPIPRMDLDVEIDVDHQRVPAVRCDAIRGTLPLGWSRSRCPRTARTGCGAWCWIAGAGMLWPAEGSTPPKFRVVITRDLMSLRLGRPLRRVGEDLLFNEQERLCLVPHPSPTPSS